MPPAGEADLRALAQRYEYAERGVRSLVERAPGGDRRSFLLTALEILIALRTLNPRAALVAAYLHEFEFGAVEAVDDLAGSLAKHLDDGVRRAQAGTRRAFRFATEENLDEMVEESVTAHEAANGGRWSLGRWATMQTGVLGRRATSRGLADSLGEGGRFVVPGEKCPLCRMLFSGTGIVGKDRMPPAHPGCDCQAVRV